MTYNDSDRVEIKNGPPPQDTQKKAIIRLVGIFIIAGVILSLLIAVNQNWIMSLVGSINSNVYAIIIQTLSGIGLSVMISGLQAYVLRKKIQERYWLFILTAGIGGAVGGFIGGVLINLSILKTGFPTGFVIGLIAGGISSLIQYQLMSLGRGNLNWIFFSTGIWALILGIGWAIAWNRQITGTILNAAFSIIAMGISLSIFLRLNPDIEFD